LLILAGPISYFQAIVLGLLQGFAELFPISSLGHSVILPRLLGWNIHQDDKYFIAFLVATHLATAIVLLVFFGRDWIRILSGMWRSLVEREVAPDNPEGRVGWLVVVATIPAGILGLLLQDKLQSVFASARSAAFFLILNGFMLYGAELLRRRAPGIPEGDSDDDVRIVKRVGWLEALGVGAAQAIALIPGFSRSGA
jgi:undecaprenyl-diphosphatase